MVSSGSAGSIREEIARNSKGGGGLDILAGLGLGSGFEEEEEVAGKVLTPKRVDSAKPGQIREGSESDVEDGWGWQGSVCCIESGTSSSKLHRFICEWLQECTDLRQPPTTRPPLRIL